MALLNLESLVLRGSVRCDVLALGLRLGTSVEGGLRTPESGPSLRHAPAAYRPAQPFAWPVVGVNPGPKPVDNPEEGAMPGAGRSRRHAGSARRSTPLTATHQTDTPTPSWFAAGDTASLISLTLPAAGGWSRGVEVSGVTARR